MTTSHGLFRTWEQLFGINQLHPPRATGYFTTEVLYQAPLRLPCDENDMMLITHDQQSDEPVEFSLNLQADCILEQSPPYCLPPASDPHHNILSHSCAHALSGLSHIQLTRALVSDGCSGVH